MHNCAYCALNADLHFMRYLLQHERSSNTVFIATAAASTSFLFVISLIIIVRCVILTTLQY